MKSTVLEYNVNCKPRAVQYMSKQPKSKTKPCNDVKETFPHPTNTNRGTITKSRMNDSIEQKVIAILCTIR